jgi:hypothetical protein
MNTGTPIAIGFYPGSQLPNIDERYMNEGVPYTDGAQVLSLLPITSRAAYLTVNIAGVEYIFLSDLTTLVNKIGSLSLLDGSVTLAKMANMATASVIYRKTAGVGVPEVQTLATLKVDLGLSGINSGDQDLSGKVDKITGKGLSAEDYTTAEKAKVALLSGTNTGDETTATIKDKLGISTLNGVNTGDQDLSDLVIKVTGKGLSKNDYTDLEKAKLGTIIQTEFRIILPPDTTVAGRCTVPTELPADWTVAAGVVPEDLVITHNLHREICFISVMSVDGVTGKKSNLPFGSAYMGFQDDQYGNVITIKGLATIEAVITIHLFFGNTLITQPA